MDEINSTKHINAQKRLKMAKRAHIKGYKRLKRGSQKFPIR